MPMITTTISSSMSVKPLRREFFIGTDCLRREPLVDRLRREPVGSDRL
jgi:hypothetical protein